MNASLSVLLAAMSVFALSSVWYTAFTPVEVRLLRAGRAGTRRQTFSSEGVVRTRDLGDRGPVAMSGPPVYERDPRVDDYLNALPPWQRELCQRQRDLIHAADPELTETIKRTVRRYFVLEGNVCAPETFPEPFAARATKRRRGSETSASARRAPMNRLGSQGCVDQPRRVRRLFSQSRAVVGGMQGPRRLRSREGTTWETSSCRWASRSTGSLPVPAGTAQAVGARHPRTQL